MPVVPMDVALLEWTGAGWGKVVFEFLIPLKGWTLPTEHIALFSVFTTMLHDVYLQSSIRKAEPPLLTVILLVCLAAGLREKNKQLVFRYLTRPVWLLKLFPRIYDTFTLTNTAVAIIFPSLVSNFTLKKKLCQAPRERFEDGSFCRCR